MAKTIQGKQPLWLGGTASVMAACCTHPLDQTKYRMQVQSARQPMLRALYMYATRDGVLSLWQGISASVLRQSTYSTARFGIYNYLARLYQRKYGIKKLSTSTTVGCAGVAGGLAGLVGNPSEIVLVRMCADGARAPAQRFAYSNAISGVIRVAQDEGFRAFFKGLGPNIVRSVLMNIDAIPHTPPSAVETKALIPSLDVSQIAVYTAAKSHLLSSPRLRLKDDTPTHVIASLAAGTVATTVCAPADVLKSRLQSANGKSQGLSKVLVSALRQEGPRFLMRGWTPAWLRLAPNTVLMFIFMEQLQRVFL